MVKIRPATIEDALFVAKRLRQQDIDEVAASHGLNGYDAVTLSFNQSSVTYAAKKDDKAICLFGVTRADGKGYPWLLGTDELASVPISFFRNSRVYVELFLGMCGRLENYVDARNTLSIQWLRWLGFTIEPEQPFGVKQMPFHYFWMEVEKCV